MKQPPTTPGRLHIHGGLSAPKEQVATIHAANNRKGTGEKG
jgi:hypothetical protein